MSGSTSRQAQGAKALVESLQATLVDCLGVAARASGLEARFEPVHWERDGGRHGGGVRQQAAAAVTPEVAAFDRASVNVSHVHYDDLPHKKLASATALSSIVHPRHPRAPSVHLHFSFTALRPTEGSPGRGYWRLMADLNPSLPHADDTASFEAALGAAAPGHYAEARAQGDRYFWIPALERHRGVTHFYLEGHDSGDGSADRDLTERTARASIEAYGAILERAWSEAEAPTSAELAAQLAYHTLYLFQVLTLDRGTTSGLLVHADNDVGVLGSLPSKVDVELLASWADRVPAPQEQLVRALAEVLRQGGAPVAPVTVEAKRGLAQAVREHYTTNPEALSHQASGFVLPPTVANHRD